MSLGRIKIDMSPVSAIIPSGIATIIDQVNNGSRAPTTQSIPPQRNINKREWLVT